MDPRIRNGADLHKVGRADKTIPADRGSQQAARRLRSMTDNQPVTLTHYGPANTAEDFSEISERSVGCLSTETKDREDRLPFLSERFRPFTF
jgi:hypothetical protein